MEIQITSGTSTSLGMKTYSTSSQDGNDVSERLARCSQDMLGVVALRRSINATILHLYPVHQWKQKSATCSDGEN
jgi:hypothetical protein